jgi:hypothetical protein
MSKQSENNALGSGNGAQTAIGAGAERRPYDPPRVLSAERLEAAAATCDPPSGGFGKTLGPPAQGGCSTLGS